eukprot:jgi/Bigna1/146381/aug1.113_g21089
MAKTHEKTLCLVPGTTVMAIVLPEKNQKRCQPNFILRALRFRGGKSAELHSSSPAVSRWKEKATEAMSEVHEAKKKSDELDIELKLSKKREGRPKRQLEKLKIQKSLCAPKKSSRKQ